MNKPTQLGCIVKGCRNQRHEGVFVGDLCAPCNHMLTSGEIGFTDSFLGHLKSRVDAVEAMRHKPGPAMSTAEFRTLRPGDIVSHRGTGQQFQVLGNFGGRVTAVDLADLTNPSEWEVVSRKVSDREIDSIMRPHIYK